jgi:hypothetical protein
MPLLRLPSPPLGAAAQNVSRPRRAPCLVQFIVATPYRTVAHAVPPPLAPARRRVADGEPTAQLAVPRAFPRRRSISHLPLTLSLLRLPSPPLGANSKHVSWPFRAPCLVHFRVAAPYRIAAHAVPPPPLLAPARRRVAAGGEPAAPRAVSIARAGSAQDLFPRYPSSSDFLSISSADHQGFSTEFLPGYS